MILTNSSSHQHNYSLSVLGDEGSNGYRASIYQ